MQSLSEVVRALRAEIAASLADEGPLPEGCRWVADRVVATLGFSVVTSPEDGASGRTPRFVVATGGGAVHSLRVEFAPGEPVPRAVGAPAATDVPAPAPRRLRGEATQPAVEILSGVFGAPGFDSSARATVFREALDPLDGAGVRRLMETLGDREPTGDRAADHARHLVRRVIASGPGTVEDGVAALRGLFAIHDAGELLGLIEDRWRTQDDWLE
ncbi:MAG: hypothetical protein DVB31_11825 [Verrucomicrobia bacterium]|nr:MAG: hypothetical protein DVB31_11825 [Verrucomicrobiota bacterium]